MRGFVRPSFPFPTALRKKRGATGFRLVGEPAREPYGSFSEAVVREMASQVERPASFPRQPVPARRGPAAGHRADRGGGGARGAGVPRGRCSVRPGHPQAGRRGHVEPPSTCPWSRPSILSGGGRGGAPGNGAAHQPVPCRPTGAGFKKTVPVERVLVDARGQPIRALAATDFRVEVDGKRVRVESVPSDGSTSPTCVRPPAGHRRGVALPSARLPAVLSLAEVKPTLVPRPRGRAADGEASFRHQGPLKRIPALRVKWLASPK